MWVLQVARIPWSVAMQAELTVMSNFPIYMTSEVAVPEEGSSAPEIIYTAFLHFYLVLPENRDLIGSYCRASISYNFMLSALILKPNSGFLPVIFLEEGGVGAGGGKAKSIAMQIFCYDNFSIVFRLIL